MIKSYDIKELIPQREPILVVDKLLDVEEDNKATTSYIITRNGFFIDDNGFMAEVGVIEHIAQSASAFAGYKVLEAGTNKPPIGYIGEVKKFTLHRLPHVGEELLTTITMGPEVEGVTILTGKTYIGREMVANTLLKIFLEQPRSF